MQNYLNNEGVAFYHITRRSAWENDIPVKGLVADKRGHIFVSRTPDMDILCSIALNQLLELEEEPDLVILKLTQVSNQFRVNEFSIDIQATELTMPVQNMIRRAHIPFEKVEFYGYLRMPFSELAIRAGQADLEFIGSALFEQAQELIYEEPNRRQYRLQASKIADIWVFKKQFYF